MMGGAFAGSAIGVVQEQAAPQSPAKLLAPAKSDEPVQARSIEPPLVEVPKVTINIGRQSLQATGSHWDGLTDSERAAATSASATASQPSAMPMAGVQQAPPPVLPPPQYLRFDPSYYGQPFGFNNGWGGGGWPVYGDGFFPGPVYNDGLVWLGSGLAPFGSIGTIRSRTFGAGASLGAGSLGVSIIPRAANGGGSNGVRYMTATYRGSGAPTPLPAYNAPIQSYRPTYNGFTIPPGHGTIKYPGGGGSRAARPTPRPGTSN